MNSEKLKMFLDSLVDAEDRDFAVEIRNKKLSRRLGMYIHRQKKIVVYGGQDQNSLYFVCVGLHELAHHIDWKKHGDWHRSLWYQGKRIPRHGKSFTSALEKLVGEWNFRYREHLKGLIEYNRKRRATPLKFSTFLTKKTNTHP